MKTKLITLLLVAVALPVLVCAQLPKRHVKKADAQTAAWRYEIDPVEVGTQGNVLVKVWSFSKKPEVAAEQARKNAVHGVIFKGVPAKDRVPGRRPLIEGESDTPFFDEFFATGGDYGRFVTLTSGGNVAAGDVMKVSKKEYKVGVVATVSYSDLRSYLEERGVLRKLDSGF